MSCYMRHLRYVFDALGLEYDKLNRARVHAALRASLELPTTAHCPEVWAAVKALTAEERDALPDRIAAHLG